MSAAAADHTLVLPDVNQRSLATVAIVTIDVMALELALLLGCVVRYFLHSIFPIGLESPQYRGLALGVLTLPLAYYWIGLYPGYGIGAVQRIRGRFYATLTIFIVLLGWNYSIQDRQWSRGVLLLTMFFALILVPALEAPLRKALVARGICGVPLVVLGAGSTGALVIETLQRESDLGFVPVAVLDDNPGKWGTKIHGVPVGCANRYTGNGARSAIRSGAKPVVREYHCRAGFVRHSELVDHVPRFGRRIGT
jgi:FlaA1/EpsC-like NDP-sugar epimerase